MIIGRDIIQELKMDVLYSSNQVKWDDQIIPLKPTTDLSSFYIRDESKAVQDATNWIKTILDAKYEKANLEEITKKQHHLNQVHLAEHN